MQTARDVLCRERQKALKSQIVKQMSTVFNGMSFSEENGI
jgi:hypothetical protein